MGAPVWDAWSSGETVATPLQRSGRPPCQAARCKAEEPNMEGRKEGDPFFFYQRIKWLIQRYSERGVHVRRWTTEVLKESVTVVAGWPGATT